MKFNKEIRVGLLSIIALVLLYLGFNFLKGSDVFSSENEYTVVFSEVNGLQNSNAVTYKGVTVGRVMEMETDQANDRVKVTLAINKTIKLTDSTRALLADDGLIGGKMIKLDVRPGGPIEEGSELIGDIELGLADAAIEKITPALNDLDSLVVNLNRLVRQFQTTVPMLDGLLTSTTQTSQGVNAVLASNANSLKTVTTNAALLTNNLNTLTMDLDRQIKPILSNAATLTDSLSKLNIGNTVAQLNTTISSLQAILYDVNNGKGTLGKLTSDDSLYLNLDNTAASLDALLGDMKSNPRRYVHFSLFGGKDKKKKVK
jgi:phospholipid/cholesterol/gamma-HCH transport system substrate-binding protein